MNKDAESWARVSIDAVCSGSPAQMRNVLAMALQDIAELARTVLGERDARDKAMAALRSKDEAMGVLFDRLRRAGVDCTDLFS